MYWLGEAIIQTAQQAKAMLTRDNQRTAQSVAQTLNLDRVEAKLLPEDKLTVISHLQLSINGFAVAISS